MEPTNDISPQRHAITKEHFNAILSPLKKEMRVWKIGIYYGSLLYFEMGKKHIDYMINKTKGDKIGEFSLTFECDDWHLDNNDREICNSETINRDFAETSLNEMMKDVRFEDVIIDIPNKMTTIYFDKSYKIRLMHDNTEVLDDYHSLFSLYLPGETIVLSQGQIPQLFLIPSDHIKEN